MISVIGKTKQGFVLAEIMVSVAILSIGLVFILQGFSYSLHVLNISENTLQAALLAEENMVEHEISSRQMRDPYFKGTSGDAVLNNLSFVWQIKVSSIEEYKNLKKILSTVSWKRGQGKGSASLISYLNIPLNEYK